jgi:hypothetical protein
MKLTDIRLTWTWFVVIWNVVPYSLVGYWRTLQRKFLPPSSGLLIGLWNGSVCTTPWTQGFSLTRGGIYSGDALCERDPRYVFCATVGQMRCSIIQHATQRELKNTVFVRANAVWLSHYVVMMTINVNAVVTNRTFSIQRPTDLILTCFISRSASEYCVFKSWYATFSFIPSYSFFIIIRLFPSRAAP